MNRSTGPRLWLFGLLLMLAANSGCVWAGEESATDISSLPTLAETIAKLPRQTASGHVIDSASKPVADADVFLYYAHGEDGLRDRLAGRTKTDPQGRFEFKDAIVWEPATDGGEHRTPPKYVILVSHLEHGIYPRILIEGDPTEELKIRMPDTDVKPYEVTVHDDNGNPIEGARVFLCDGEPFDKDSYDSNHQRFRLQQDIGVSSELTGPDGKALVRRGTGGRWWAEKEGYARAWIPNNECILFPSASVSGKVTYPDGSPASEAAVWFDYQGNRLGWSTVTQTDKEGRYAFPNVPGAGYRYSWMPKSEEEGAKGEVKLKVDDLRPKSPFAAQQIGFTLQPGDKAQKDIQLARGCIIQGTVVDLSTGKPAPNVCLNRYIQIPGQRYLDSQQLKTGADGTFQCIVAPGSQVSFQWEQSREGDYIIDNDWRQQGNWQPMRETTVQQDTTGLTFNIKLWPVQELKGQVVDDQGNGVGGSKVYISSEVPEVATDDQGHFTLKTAPTDRDFDLFAMTGDKSRACVVRLPAGSTQATLALEPTREYKGEVTNGAGLPANNLKFYMDLRLNDSNLYRARIEPTTDQDGHFTASGMCPKATYYAWWSSDNDENRDYDYGNATLDMTKINQGDPIRFEAKQFVNAMLGRVVDEGGQPVGATLEVRSQDKVPQNNRNKKFTCDDKGGFSVDRLAAGDVQLRVSAEGFKTRSITAPSDAIDLEIVLKNKAGSEIDYNIKVTDPEGKPIAKAPVSLWMQWYGRSGATTATLESVTDKEGKGLFTFAFPKPAAQDQSADTTTTLTITYTDRAGKKQTIERVVPAGGNGRGCIGCMMDGYFANFQGVIANEDADITMVMSKEGQPWSGRVINDQNVPMAGARVRVSAMRVEGAEHTSLPPTEALDYRTDKDGRFVLKQFSNKNWTNIEISAKDYATEHAYFDPSRDTGEKAFTIMPAGGVAGQIRFIGAGAPAMNSIHVALNSTNGGGSGGLVQKDGTFRFSDTRPGQYVLYAGARTTESQEWVCPDPPILMIEARTTQTVTVAMERGTPVRGKMVVAGTDAPPKGGKSINARKDRSYRGSGKVNDDGSWEIFLPPGTFDLEPYAEGMDYNSRQTTSVTVEKGKPVEGLVIEIKMQ